MEIIFYLLVFYGLILGATYFIICKRLLGLAMQYTNYEIKTEQQVPTEIKNVFSNPILESTLR